SSSTRSRRPASAGASTGISGMHRSVSIAVAFALAIGAAAARAEEGPFAAKWEVPEEGCKPRGGLHAAERDADASLVFLFAPGAAADAKSGEQIRRFLPKEVWANRERFFYDGMRLEIGPCFRDYAPPAFFREATEKFRGTATLTEDGGLDGYTA